MADRQQRVPVAGLDVAIAVVPSILIGTRRHRVAAAVDSHRSVAAAEGRHLVVVDSRRSWMVVLSGSHRHRTTKGNRKPKLAAHLKLANSASPAREERAGWRTSARDFVHFTVKSSYREQD